jgi:hypothetical protein
VEYKLDLTLAFEKATGKDSCVLCGDIIEDMRYSISSNRTKANKLMLLFDEPCLEQIAALSLKTMLEIQGTKEEGLN